MKYILTFLLAFQFYISGVSQSTFSFDPDSIILEKTTDFEFFYYPTQFENLTGDTLFMRWKKVDFYLSGGHGGGASNWGITIQDPNTFY